MRSVDIALKLIIVKATTLTKYQEVHSEAWSFYLVNESRIHSGAKPVLIPIVKKGPRDGTNQN